MNKKKMKISLILSLGLMTVLPGCRQVNGPDVLLDGVKNVRGIETGDLNNDGKTDLAVAVRNKGILVFYGDGKKFATLPGMEITVAQPQDLKIGDFDGDGKTDLAVVDSFKQNFHLFLGKEALSKDHASADCNQFCGYLEAGKINEEGNCDFLTGPVWRKWMGNGRFKHGFFQYVPGNGNGKSCMADLNADGIKDVIFITNENKIRIYYGPFPELKVTQFDVVAFTELKSPDKADDILCMDLDNDGRQDIIAAGKDGGVFVYFQNAPMDFSNGAAPSKVLKTAGPALIAVEKDGSLLVVAEKESGRIYILNVKKENRNITKLDSCGIILESMIKISYMKVIYSDGDSIPEVIAGTSNITSPDKIIKLRFNSEKMR